MVFLCVDYVVKKFPDANEYAIKAAMAQKCKDIQRAMECKNNK